MSASLFQFLIVSDR